MTLIPVLMEDFSSNEFFQGYNRLVIVLITLQVRLAGLRYSNGHHISHKT